jgi:molybdopterin-guanine dinucleotide biosynthesis protein A
MEAGLAAARHPLVFVAAGDMPFLRPELVDHLLGVLQERGSPAAVPDDGRRTHPLCAAYSRGVLPSLRSALDGGVRAAREFLGGLDGVAYVPAAELRSLGDPDLLLMNVNSPEDLARARSVVGT